MNVEPLQPGCFWSDFSGLLLPNLRWCEEQLCSWVVEPANTWSNLAYVLIGAWLWARGERRRDDLQRVFGKAQVVVGVFSLVYHMSFSGLLQFLDFAAMFVFVGLTLTLNFVRLGWLAPERRARAHTVGVIVMTLVTIGVRFTPFPIQFITPVFTIATIVTEVMLARRQKARYGWYFASLACLGGAMVASILDAQRIWCDPHDHVLQGHAVWHVLSAVALGLAWRFYAQFDMTGRSRAEGRA